MALCMQMLVYTGTCEHVNIVLGKCSTSDIFDLVPKPLNMQILRVIHDQTYV